MKSYKQILEAINRGIKFALDDFDGQEVIQGQTNSKINHYKGSWNEVLDSFVDLGLPSEILWCKCNLGAKHEYDYGNYYAWGELTTKNVYNWDSYTYESKPKQLPPECDVATQILGENYSIPTKEQWNELLKYTDNEWVENYNGTGINGRLFISKISNNSMFIPAAGYRHGSNLYENGTNSYTWSSILYTNLHNNAWCLYFNIGGIFIDRVNHCEGLPVRPVVNL